MPQVLNEMKVTRNFLASWFAGSVSKSKSLDNFYLSQVLAPNFEIVRPDGRRLSRTETLAGFFERLYGHDPQVERHENRNIHPILVRSDLVIVGYEESHVYADHELVNALTAVFVKDELAPNGVLWQLVHETPISGE